MFLHILTSTVCSQFGILTIHSHGVILVEWRKHERRKKRVGVPFVWRSKSGKATRGLLSLSKDSRGRCLFHFWIIYTLGNVRTVRSERNFAFFFLLLVECLCFCSFAVRLIGNRVLINLVYNVCMCIRNRVDQSFCILSVHICKAHCLWIHRHCTYKIKKQNAYILMPQMMSCFICRKVLCIL